MRKSHCAVYCLGQSAARSACTDSASPANVLRLRNQPAFWGWNLETFRENCQGGKNRRLVFKTRGARGELSPGGSSFAIACPTCSKMPIDSPRSCRSNQSISRNANRRRGHWADSWLLRCISDGSFLGTRPARRWFEPVDGSGRGPRRWYPAKWVFSPRPWLASMMKHPPCYQGQQTLRCSLARPGNDCH